MIDQALVVSIEKKEREKKNYVKIWGSYNC